MGDYNDGLIPEPCLRLDFGFGRHYASVELGDGTGYVRLADYEKLDAENEKLREFAYDMWNDMNVYYTQHESPDSSDMDFYRDRMCALGIEVEE